jgi:hypothetical protein
MERVYRIIKAMKGRVGIYPKPQRAGKGGNRCRR